MTEVWLQLFGAMWLEHSVETIDPTVLNALEQVNGRIREVADLLVGDCEDELAFAQKLQMLKVERRRLVSTPATARQVISSGLAFRDAWDRAQGVTERRNLLASSIERITVMPGRAGRRPMNPDRVEIVWAAT